jgi:hypothetical protein
MSNNASNAEVFVYTDQRGERIIPHDVVRVRVDPSVTSISARACHGRNKLVEVELCEGPVEIGEGAFAYCGHSITKINIPASLRTIDDYAFYQSLRTPIRLHDGIESIGRAAFFGCIFTNFRVPPLITVIPACMLSNCKSTFSVEISKDVTVIENYALYKCYCLRNVAIPLNAVIGDDIFIHEEEEEDDDDDEIGDENELRTDLQLLFGSELEIIRELKHRFDGLPIHYSVYFQPYHQGALQRLITPGNELDQTGNQQDCLGMTPLHILACSSVHDLVLPLNSCKVPCKSNYRR